VTYKQHCTFWIGLILKLVEIDLGDKFHISISDDLTEREVACDIGVIVTRLTLPVVRYRIACKRKRGATLHAIALLHRAHYLPVSPITVTCM
jgi:hypothetical protein